MCRSISKQFIVSDVHTYLASEAISSPRCDISDTISEGTEVFMRKQRSRIYSYRGFQSRRFSLLLITGLLVPVVLAFVAAAVFVMPKLHSHAAATNGDCSLIVPANPLSAQGLATPYRLAATDAAKGPCNEGNAAQAAFVQGAVIDPATGNISIYNPLVIDKGTQPAIAPVVPMLPKGAIVGIWFGFNGNTLTLRDSNNSLQDGHCVNGLPGSIFGQVSYCNAAAFFQAANQAIQAGKLVPPALGMGQDGLPCPTTRDFSIVDQDQSDNVTTTYLITASDQVAQNNQANAAALGGQMQKNGSDERLLTLVDSALGCNPWMAPDLADPGQMLPSLPLNELQAAAHQARPVARVPEGDPMVLTNDQPDLNKLNAYRRGVDQSPVGTQAAASTTTYCKHLLAIGPTRIQLDMQLTQGRPSPDPAAANSLFTFLTQRFDASYGANGLNCVGLLNVPDPITVTTNANGVAIDATFNGGNTDTQNQNTNPAAGAVTTPTSGATTTPTAPTTSPTVDPTTGATPTPTAPATSPTVD